MKIYLHGPMGSARTNRVRSRVEDPSLAERRVPERGGIPVVECRRKYMHRIVPVTRQKSKTHVVAECDLHTVGRDVLEMGTWKVNRRGRNHVMSETNGRKR